MDYIFSALAFICGALLAFLNYRISRCFLKKDEGSFALVSVLRQLLNITFLAALFFIGQYTSLNQLYLLIGGALGITLPMLFFTPRLLRYADERKKENEDG